MNTDITRHVADAAAALEQLHRSLQHATPMESDTIRAFRSSCNQALARGVSFSRLAEVLLIPVPALAVALDAPRS